MFGLPDGDPFFTLMTNYKYIYNATDKTADYFDGRGNKFYHRDNIQTVADLHIDFTVHKSHQFEIHIKSNSGQNRGNQGFKYQYDPRY